VVAFELTFDILRLVRRLYLLFCCEQNMKMQAEGICFSGTKVGIGSTLVDSECDRHKIV
jgi:hypothetical protein